jgi:hypothetical protein
MDDLFSQMFSGGATFDIFMEEGFDEFTDILTRGSDKAFKGMFRDLGKNARMTKGVSARKAAQRGGKGGKSKGAAAASMGMGFPGGGKGGLDDLMGGIGMMMASMMMDDMGDDEDFEK